LSFSVTPFFRSAQISMFNYTSDHLRCFEIFDVSKENVHQTTF